METICDKVNALWKSGKSYKEIGKELNLTRDSIAYNLSTKGIMANDRKKAMAIANEKFLQEVIKVLPYSTSLNDVCKNLGLRGVEGYFKKVKKIINENNLDTSHFLEYKKQHRWLMAKIPDEDFFVKDSNRHGASIIQRLIEKGIKIRQCEKCGNVTWEGNEIPLQVHHINGDHYDNRIENIQLLCPNCHTLTDNFCGKNHKYNKEITEANKEKKSFKVTKMCNDIVDEKAIYIERQELFRLFKQYKSFVQVGKYLNLSDNGVRKRCKKLGILDDILKMNK